jgi:hypothetical protein
MTKKHARNSQRLTLNEKKARELATRQIEREAREFVRDVVQNIKEIDAYERRLRLKKR